MCRWQDHPAADRILHLLVAVGMVFLHLAVPVASTRSVAGPRWRRWPAGCTRRYGTAGAEVAGKAPFIGARFPRCRRTESWGDWPTI